MEPIRIEQFFLGCLAHASYMVASEGVAAVIDPQRDVDIYVDAAKEAGWQIEHIIETHLHADFVSGHHELAERTGARIYLGDGSGASFMHTAVKDGDSIQFGNCRIDFMQTPGHTVESACAVLTDLGEPSRPKAVFTGDTLFVGDVGRPDLSGDHTPQELAAMLYRSLHEKLLKLPDDTEVFPAHGAGSLCGRQMSSERSSTIGKERRTNYALQAKSSDEFVSLLTESLPPRPEYFGYDVELNRRGAAALEQLPQLTPLRASEVLRLQSEGAVVLDTRPAMDFAVAHVPGSIHIALSGQYASWAARILGLYKRIILVGEDADHLRESQLRLARVGIEKADTYLEDGVSGWVKSGYELDYIPQVSATELADLLDQDDVSVLDVRESTEVQGGAIENSIRIPLGQLPARTDELDHDKLMVVHCKGGYRSSIATSILRRAGFRDVANLTGGHDAWLVRNNEMAGSQL
ncbi:MBL fold metallo-hydrolase [Alloacidobacterium dinghuense]|uniref:MBL fold metallo-hydrolase n=1 Tax=Alloacidobacterium dinghuense TaxID=2763107 RepID=A0A7G8BFP0_9BACT|nr:MBL fold metallo-hydrolase [Alloacidobacterium dinghuense]QNI31360.1 MBL fold metallo-hydrolase [Alloacidobacterium dinghuense]